MADKMRIAIIFGGRSGEHEVSLMSARSVLDVIDRDRYEVYEVGITRDGRWVCGENVHASLVNNSTAHLSSAAFLPDVSRNGLYQIASTPNAETLIKIANLDVVFPVLHGTYGEDGTIQGLFEMMDIAYVGAGVLGSSVGMDKGLFKDVMLANGIPVVPSVLVSRLRITHHLDSVIQSAESLSPYPLFVKPANLGSSVGVSKCVNRSDLAEGILDAVRYDRRVLIERGVNAREIEVSVLGNEDPKASIPGEIVPGADFYSYDAKYILDNSTLLIPAPLAPDAAEQIRSLAVKAYSACDCSGMARVDFLIEKDTGEIFLNEINTIPGFTRISMYPKLWEATGLPYKKLVDELIRLALERKTERDQIERNYGRQG